MIVTTLESSVPLILSNRFLFILNDTNIYLFLCPFEIAGIGMGVHTF